MKINRFMSQIDSIARQNQFEVEVFQPSIGLRIRGMRCQKVSLPNKTLATNPYSLVPSGPAENMVTQVQYPQAQYPQMQPQVQPQVQPQMQPQLPL